MISKAKSSQGASRVRHKFADRALKWSTIAWFGVAVLGQAMFAVYIALFYGGSSLRGDIAAWRDVLPDRVNAGDTVGIATMGLHLTLALLITIAGPLQLIPALRARMPALHRWTGRLYITLGFIISLGGLYMIWFRRDAEDTLIGSAPLTLNALLIMVFAVMAYTAARARRIDVHRQWALRLFMAMSGVWFLRIGVMVWILTIGTDGLGGRLEGPVGTLLKFACYLVPLIILELYFLSQRQSAAGPKWAMAGVIAALTIPTAVGIGMAAVVFWLPHM